MVRGNPTVSLMLSSPQIQEMMHSTPRPNPAWGMLPYFRKSRYQE